MMNLKPSFGSNCTKHPFCMLCTIDVNESYMWNILTCPSHPYIFGPLFKLLGNASSVPKIILLSNWEIIIMHFWKLRDMSISVHILSIISKDLYNILELWWLCVVSIICLIKTHHRRCNNAWNKRDSFVFINLCIMDLQKRMELSSRPTNVLKPWSTLVPWPIWH